MTVRRPSAPMSIPHGGRAAFELRDWRIAEGSSDELTEDQKKPWNVEIAREGYGVGITFTAHDGTTRTVNLEIDLGNIHVICGNSDRPDLVATIMENQTHIAAVQQPAAETAHSQSVICDENGMRPADGAPEPGFAGSSGPRP